jgi:hypothetical protein
MKLSITSTFAFLFAVVLANLWPVTAHAQITGFPTGGTPAGDMANMTPEQAQAMADQMMLQLGGQLGLDPEALRNATPRQREEMLRGAADVMSNQAVQQFESNIGMSVEEFKNLSKEDQAALMMPRSDAPETRFDPMPLPAAPGRGFPDGSIPLPVAADYTTDLAVDEPVGQEFLLVVADMIHRQIVWREMRIAPFEEHLNLLEIAPEPSALIVELIDPDTHRVIRRYRPVAAAE